jgi:exonuclease SbcC
MDAHEKALALFHASQASVLARTLVPDTPCPVCGSTVHPSPAPAGSHLPDEKILKKQKDAISLKEKQLKGMNDALAALVQDDQGLENRIAFMAEELARDFPGLTKETESPVLTQYMKKASSDLALSEKNLKSAMDDEKQTKALEESLDASSFKEKELAEELERLVTASNESERDRSTCAAVAEERKTRIPEDFSSLSDLTNAITTIEQDMATFKKTLETAHERHLSSKKALEAAKEGLSAADQARLKLRDGVESMIREFSERLEQTGFTGEDDYRLALSDVGHISRLEKTVREYGENRKAAEDRTTRAEDACKGLVMPDLAALETTLAAITQQLELENTEKTRLETHLTGKKATLKTLNTLMTQSIKIETYYAVTGRMADVAAGKNPSGMTFQRYVLSALLDDVLFSAGRHLKSMSRNRFDLERAQERADMRSAGGLDLMVADAHTGTTRPVATLSGGESFLASLSLALGLADVVQAYAGGIKLDTIFVDEGFGTLDPETLDLAFRAFADLQVQGRLVGIISHVPELKERSTARLEVIPGNRGSRARFVL